MTDFSKLSSFIWSIADLLRSYFKRSQYQDVILPFTVLRRIDCVLAPTKEKVLDTNAKYKAKLENLDALLRKASGFAFYNTSLYDFPNLLGDAPNLAKNLRNYIAGFSPNMREVIERFDFDNTIKKLEEAGLLFLVMERFKNIDLSPQAVPNTNMGYIFEDLIRRFNEALDENPGEHFTPREVIQLMVNLLMVEQEQTLGSKGLVKTVYDPCCGTGGMLTIAKDHIKKINPEIDVYLFGQEVIPETFAICKSDLFIKSADGRDAEGIVFGNTLSADAFPQKQFNFMLSNPPYGKEWKAEEAAVRAEAEKGDVPGNRFRAGLPRISDGQLLFLQHMISRMNTPAEGGSRIAIVMNGSPLFTGDAGSGESEIRRWILENDWLEAIVALPEQLFYNTGIATYIWVLSNKKPQQRKGKVQLVNATECWKPMRKSLGDKRREISNQHIDTITEWFSSFHGSETCRLFDTTDFGYRKITIERPLLLNFQASPERIEKLRQERAFQALAESKKKNQEQSQQDKMAGLATQELIMRALREMPADLFLSRGPFEDLLETALKEKGLKIGAPLKKVILNALSERDENAEVCRDSKGNPEPDPELRDTENVPLKQDIYEYFESEVLPHVPDAWINTAVTDHRDGQVGKVGYEINFNRYFYKYTPPRPLEEIEADIREIEREILEMLREVAQ